MIHFLICTVGGADLVEIALRSIDRYAGECQVDIMKLDEATLTPRSHGAAIDFWRERQKVGVKDTDAVCIMDPDVALLSEWWRREVDRALFEENPGNVGIWGAGAVEDYGPRVHASMMVIRGRLFNDLIRSFTPCLDPRERMWRDTGGLYCMWAKDAGWAVMPVERADDWHGFSAWYSRPEENRHVVKGSLTSAHYPMWTHLGGGTHSDPTRLTLWQRIRRWKTIRRRKAFIKAVMEHLA